jgi:hypothetical protein
MHSGVKRERRAVGGQECPHGLVNEKTDVGRGRRENKAGAKKRTRGVNNKDTLR